MEQLREIQWEKDNAAAAEKERLKEKVLCAEITFPPAMQKELGILGYSMKACDVADWVEQELDDGDAKSLTVTIKYSMRTNKWIESLPEANI